MIKLEFDEPAIAPILFIMCLGLAIASLEDYKSRHHIFGAQGILSWDVLKFSNPNTLNSRFWKFIGLFQAPIAFQNMLLFRMFLAIAIAVVLLAGVTHSGVLFFFVLLLLLTHLLVSLRSLYGLDGAHQMNLILLVSATLYYIATPKSFAREVCILFIGTQAVTSYVVSGIYKWMGEKWRNGTAMSGIMSARIYGHPWFGTFLRNKPATSKAMCWMVILFETSFLFTLFAPPVVMTVFLCCGIVFHILNAVFMGLNGFFFSFVATYPAVLYLNYFIRSASSGIFD